MGLAFFDLLLFAAVAVPLELFTGLYGWNGLTVAALAVIGANLCVMFLSD